MRFWAIKIAFPGKAVRPRPRVSHLAKILAGFCNKPHVLPPHIPVSHIQTLLQQDRSYVQGANRFNGNLEIMFGRPKAARYRDLGTF